MLDVATLREALGKKISKAGSRRAFVTWAIEEKSYSRRRVCSLIGLDPKTYRYASRQSDDATIRERLKTDLLPPNSTVYGWSFPR